ncbi:bifunctional DNA primase/polymerase [Streptomyces poriferorum]|uniref:bifunctional DNA primase/polymerase n=1 Tax=Streptomyces poriferorum TaxID=2798799 RepID=UPI00273E3BF4|nr:bifunctional DNA primase/polymerase [Streptomyces sp. Alt1]WLQ51290.1 bifunctional DNA primase/polymerase [Streptomyces sp. Alt1]
MTQPAPVRRESGHRSALLTALHLADRAVPVLPLRAGKIPFGNCPNCRGNACGGRPNMKAPGPCRCPRVCHAWAAATTDPTLIASPAWAGAWRQAVCVGYHPGGVGLTIVDLDHADAMAWARDTLPPTRTVPTTRGAHWLYQGTMRSVNGVRDGVDIKSSMSYARWLGPGTGTMTALPDVVRALIVRTPATVRPANVTVPAPVGNGECPHRTSTYLDRGIAMAEQRITEARSAVHATVYRTFLAVLSGHGRCGCLTDTHIGRLFTAAQAKGETARHCTDAWTNARTALGM